MEDADRQEKLVHKKRVHSFVSRRGTPLSDDQLEQIIHSYQGRQIIDMLRYTAKGTGTEVREYLQWFKDHAKADELMISPQAPTFEETVHTMGIIARSMQ